MDHPRMGGEKKRCTHRTVISAGSPPHGRGKASHSPEAVTARRITPAWAGKSWPGYTAPCRFRDHPRMGGEKLSLLSVTDGQGGSPPHGRGKGKNRIIPILDPRITPAWAGKSGFVRDRAAKPQDHPRMGGEKCYVGESQNNETGSPPHGRGKDPAVFSTGDEDGITPAWAGKRSICRRSRFCRQDHPRMGGEKFSIPACASMSCGSPPHGRGKVLH